MASEELLLASLSKQWVWLVHRAITEFPPRYFQSYQGLFGERSGMEWNQDLNPGGLGMELES